jgi:hypothetical protein
MRQDDHMTDPFAPPPSDPTPASPFGAPVYGAPVYGAPAEGAAVVPRNGFGTTALVLGILATLGSLFVIPGIVLGVPAIGFGFLGRRRAKRLQATNGGLALWGVISGVVGLAISGGIVALFLVSDRGRAYLDCVRVAPTTVAQNACRDSLIDSYR